LNARPGLNIQIANQTGLLTRLKRIEEIDKEKSVEERLQFIEYAFGDPSKSIANAN
jgi:hypothetical protein